MSEREVKPEACENCGEPAIKLRKVYRNETDHVCFSWWCEDCRWLLEDAHDEDWPRSSDGRFFPSQHCETPIA